MPGINAGSDVTPIANPTSGMGVLLSPFSGPTGSPYDALKADYDAPDTEDRDADPDNLSTGALNTGIGFGPTVAAVPVDTGMNPVSDSYRALYQPGITMPDGTDAVDARLTCIGGGQCDPALITTDGIAVPTPFNTQPLLAMGNGQARDSATYVGVPVVGFGTKLVASTGAVNNGSAIVSGFVNRSGNAMKTARSEFGVSTTPSPDVELAD